MASPISPDNDIHSMAHHSTSTPSPLPAWHFPFGPSTKYHQRERRKPPSQHSRNNSSHTPRAPALATERRSHHRRALTNIPSPPSSSSDYSQSPLRRFPSSTTSFMANHALPTTPAKGHRRRSSHLLHDSPFSDYFTDPDAAPSFVHIDDMPSSATQQLLLRMNKLQSQLIRDTASTPSPCSSSSSNSNTPHPTHDDAIAIVGRHLTSLEHELSALSTQTQYPPELTDSGLFLQPEDQPQAVHRQHSNTSNSPASEDTHPPLTLTHLRAERDYFLLETQRLLTGLRAAQAQLRHRYDDLRALHDQHDALSARTQLELEARGRENAGLRADLAGDAAELLFLKVQLKHLEARVATSTNDNSEGQGTAQTTKMKKKHGWMKEMDEWRVDWSEVEERFRRRRAADGAETEDREEGTGRTEAKWWLDVAKTVDGHTTCVTIKRIENEAEGEEDSVGDVETEYTDQGTQTEAEVAEVLESNAKEPNEPIESDECAITTSSEASHTDVDGVDAEIEETRVDEPNEEAAHEDLPEKDGKYKSAWQELWDGLTKLANMDEAHF